MVAPSHALHLPPLKGQFWPPCAPPHAGVGAPLSLVKNSSVSSHSPARRSAAVTLATPSSRHASMPAKVRRGSGSAAYGSVYGAGTSRGACTAWASERV